LLSGNYILSYYPTVVVGLDLALSSDRVDLNRIDSIQLFKVLLYLWLVHPDGDFEGDDLLASLLLGSMQDKIDVQELGLSLVRFDDSGLDWLVTLPVVLQGIDGFY
jgi:hypothetical protein